MTVMDLKGQKTIADYADDLRTGRRFLQAAASSDSADRMSYSPPMSSAAYGRAIAALGKYAQSGDRAAATVRTILPNLPLYGTAHQFLAKVCRSLAEVASNGYEDVIGATGPNATRRSAYQHPTTIKDGMALQLLLVEIQIALGAGAIGFLPNVGWVMSALIEEHGLPVHSPYLPNATALIGK